MVVISLLVLLSFALLLMSYIKPDLQLDNPTSCLNALVIHNKVMPGHNVSIDLLTICYLLPFVNFLFLNSAPYSIAMHQRLRVKDDNCSIGFKTIAAASCTAFLIYVFEYLVANLAHKDDSPDRVPLIFKYILMNSSYASFPFFVLTMTMAVMQMSYDTYMAVEYILIAYRELMYKSYSTRLDRLEKIQLLGKDAI